MALPDIARLAAAPASELRDFGRALAALGVSLKTAHPIVNAGLKVAPPLRKPIRAYHLRKLKSPMGHAMRMFLFSDPVTPDEARAALGGRLDRLVELGLLERRDEGVMSPFVVSVIDDMFVISDDLALGDDAVMGFGETTVALARAALPDRPVGSALDVGCGSGTCGLALARRAGRVVATDINARAVALTRVNAALNGITNLEAREGSLFDPVKGERFDIVVSQPPFVPKPEGIAEATFQYGGRRGDEIARALLADLPAHLAPKGRAVLMIEWPDTGGPAPEASIREALGAAAVDVLVLEAPGVDPDDHAVAYAAASHPQLDAAFEAEAILRRSHLAGLGVKAIVPTLAVVQPAGGPGWTSTVRVEPFMQIEVTSGRIDKLLAARALAGHPEAILAARLRVPEGTVLAQEQVGPGAEVPSTLAARFAGSALVPKIEMTEELLLLVTGIHEAATAREGIEQFAEAREIAADQGIARALPIVEQALLYGLLEIDG